MKCSGTKKDIYYIACNAHLAVSCMYVVTVVEIAKFCSKIMMPIIVKEDYVVLCLLRSFSDKKQL